MEHDKTWYQELIANVASNVEFELDPELYVSASRRRCELNDLIGYRR